MTLAFADGGELQPGVYPMTMDTLYEVFVEQAPNQKCRRVLYSALRLHLDILTEVGGPSTVILGGGFISHRPSAPTDVDLVYFCRDSEHLATILADDAGLSLLTLQNGYIAKPAMFGFKRLQPVGGKVDAFLTTPRREHYWRGLWSTVKGTGENGDPRVERGYVEVAL